MTNTLEIKQHHLFPHIKVVKIVGRWFALHGWNGHRYDLFWETDEDTYSLCKNETFTAEPVYVNNEIIDYIIKKN